MDGPHGPHFSAPKQTLKVDWMPENSMPKLHTHGCGLVEKKKGCVATDLADGVHVLLAQAGEPSQALGGCSGGGVALLNQVRQVAVASKPVALRMARALPLGEPLQGDHRKGLYMATL